MSTCFLLDPFEFPYYFYRIRGELIYVLSIVVHIPSTFCPTLGYHQGRCPWCNGYRRRNWTRRHEFKSWTDCISHSTNTLGKGMNPIILPPAMGK